MEIHDLMKQCQIFENLTSSDIKSLQYCFKTHVKKVKKGQDIVKLGETNEDIILFLEGQAKCIYTDYFDNETIISSYTFGDVYALEDAFLNKFSTTYCLTAITDCTILTLNRYRVVKCCENNCAKHQQVISNCVNIVAKQNQFLLEKLSQVTKKSTREKVLTYLQSVSKKKNSTYFDIPYNRQELADYLSVDRSALSFELSKLKKDNLIDYSKNHFRLLFMEKGKLLK